MSTRGLARRAGSAAGPSARASRAGIPAGPQARVLALQAAAGNRAVSGLLGVQRDPDPPPPEPSVATRIAEAKEHLKKGELDDPAFEHYRTATAGTAAEVADLLWQNELYLVDVDPTGAGLTAKAEQKAVRDFGTQLRDRVTKALNAKLHALAVEVTSKDKKVAEQAAKKIADQVETSLRNAPMWGEGSVTDRLFEQWVGPVPITSRSPAAAAELWTALRAASGAVVAGARGTKLSKTALAGLDTAEVAAVRTLLDPSLTWVVTEQDTTDLTDRVAGALGRPANHADAAWTELRGRMSTLILAAEVELINATVPQSKKIPLVAPVWANFRNRYVATLVKPMWTYYRHNIVDAEILGERYPKSVDNSGVHRDVQAVLPLVEESAMRLGGFASKADLRKANQRPGSEFRFESMSHPDWMGAARHLSFHGTGRAMDFRDRTNPAFGGPAHQLVSILGGGELSELSAGSTAQRQDLQKVAAHNADVVRLRGELQDRLGKATDPAEKTRLQADIDRIDAHLRDEVATDTTTVTVRNRAIETHKTVKDIEARFIQTWGTIKLLESLPFGDDLAATLLGETVDAAADAARQALDVAVAAKSPDVATIRARIGRIEEVRTLLNNPRAVVGKQTRGSMLATVGKVAGSGITDMPSWMVQAFAERGWQWGMWGGFADAMHFDYMGPVADVRADAQYL